MDREGNSGFAITKDGDIIGVFRHKLNGRPGATAVMIPLAIENGGNKLDCYGTGLVRIYERYGFYPVARVEFNEELANPGWDETKGRPEVIFMAHNGEDAATVIRKANRYHHWTIEEILSLPLFSKNEYMEAWNYRDSILPQIEADKAKDSVATGPIIPEREMRFSAADGEEVLGVDYEDGSELEDETPPHPSPAATPSPQVKPIRGRFCD